MYSRSHCDLKSRSGTMGSEVEERSRPVSGAWVGSKNEEGSWSGVSGGLAPCARA